MALCLGGLLALTGACGDDDGDGNGGTDAAVADAGADANEADAGEELAHSGLIAVTDLTITDPEAVALGLSGANISIGWTDDATATVDPVPGFESNLGACKIIVYDIAAGDVPPTPTDEGPVTVSGTANDDIVCAFDEGTTEYMCQSADAAASGEIPVGSTATPTGDGTVAYTIMGADFSNATYTGMWVQVEGFADPGAAANGRFPIVAVPNETTLVVANPALLAPAAVADDAGSYATAAGAGPIPGGFDFLDPEVAVNINKEASDAVPVINESPLPSGEGFTLEGTQPHAVPTNGDAVTFACPDSDADLEGGDCGTAAAGLVVFTISGSTTDAEIPEDAAFNAMPAPVNQYATFQCSMLPPKTGGMLSEEAMAALLGTNPTRIQFNISYASAVSGNTNVVVGHTLTGFTDVEP